MLQVFFGSVLPRSKNVQPVKSFPLNNSTALEVLAARHNAQTAIKRWILGVIFVKCEME